MFGIDDAAIGMIAAGALSTAGQLYANQRNIQAQQKANSESINLANTAHQREVLDLVAAGLNPVLSAGGNGAAVPQLGAATVDNPGEGISRGLSSAMKYANAEYQTNLAVKSAQAENLVNQGELFRAEADLIRAGRGGITGAGKIGEEIGDAIGTWIGEKFGDDGKVKSPVIVPQSAKTVLEANPRMRREMGIKSHSDKPKRKHN